MQAVKNQPAVLPAWGIFHLFVVYIVWSSTYLAIRVAVAEGSGFTPFAMGASRMVVAGLLLLAFGYVRKERMIPTVAEMRVLAISGTLLWVGANGLVMWAEQHANSGFAALMVASSPIWTALMSAIAARRRPSLLLIFSLLLGFLGSGVLMIPSLLLWNHSEIYSGVALVVAAISWAFGSFYQARYSHVLSAPVSSGYQHLFSCVGFTLLALLFNEPWPEPVQQAWWAWGYLVLFGSVFAFTSFVYTLRLLPLNIAMTYAYVNPVLALFLGWWLLNEPITIWTVVGSVMVVAGVIGVFKDRSTGKG
jgi:drug/metabolite transporter (DMT)-like permease